MTNTSDTVKRDIGLVIVVLVGVSIMGAGGYGAYIALHQHPIDIKLVGLCFGVGLFGALLLPSIFELAYPRVKAFFFLILPNGLPRVGGQRIGDPPAPTPQPPAPPADQPPPPPPWPPPPGGAG